MLACRSIDATAFSRHAGGLEVDGIQFISAPRWLVESYSVAAGTGCYAKQREMGFIRRRDVSEWLRITFQKQQARGFLESYSAGARLRASGRLLRCQGSDCAFPRARHCTAINVKICSLQPIWLSAARRK